MSGTAFLADHRGTSRSCVCLCPPINYAVVCDHLSRACYWFQRATPHSCKDEVLPSRVHLNGIVFRQPCGSWLEMASPRCSEASSKHSCYAVAGLTVKQFSIASLRTYRMKAVQNFTLQPATDYLRDAERLKPLQRYLKFRLHTCVQPKCTPIHYYLFISEISDEEDEEIQKHQGRP